VFRGSPATEPASPGGRVDSLEAPLPPVDGAGTLTPRDEGGLAFAVLLSPALLPDRGARFAPTQLLVATDGRPVTQEQVRTLIEATLPTATVRTDADLAAEATVQLDELGRIVVLGLFGTMLMAGCSLAVATAGGLIERRWPFALLRLAGMPLGRLRAMLVIEAAAPLAVAAVVSAAMGLAVGQLVLRLSASGVAEVGGIVAPDATSLAIVALAVAAALGVVGLALPLLGRVTDTESTRFE
jgi:predicted lysophospholipase L1 biosynthesis ABC-type transport system permease subunit